MLAGLGVRVAPFLSKIIRPRAGLVGMRGSARARAAVKTEQGPPPHYGKGLRPFDRAAYSRVRANRIEAATSVASKSKGKDNEQHEIRQDPSGLPHL